MSATSLPFRLHPVRFDGARAARSLLLEHVSVESHLVFMTLWAIAGPRGEVRQRAAAVCQVPLLSGLTADDVEACIDELRDVGLVEAVPGGLALKRHFCWAAAVKEPIPGWLRAQVHERDGHRCLHCGATERLSCDHIYPESLGGPTVLENLQTLCRSCNSRKGAKVA